MYENLMSISEVIVRIVGILIIGYIVGRISKIIMLFFLRKIIGLDKWLESYNIKISNTPLSVILSNLTKNFIYLIFFAYAFIYSGVDFLVKFGNLLLNLIIYIIIIIIALLAVHLLIKLIIEEVFAEINILERNRQLVRVFSAVIYMITIMIVLDYLNLLSKALLYVFLILLSGFVIFVAVTFGIAYGEKIKEEIKKDEQKR